MFTLPLWAKGLIFAGTLLTGFVVKRFWPNYKDDNPVEEYIEDLIEDHLDMHIDLTPLSEENDKDPFEDVIQ